MPATPAPCWPRRPSAAPSALVLAMTLGLTLGLPAAAAPVSYRLDPAQSTVAFETDFGADRISGSFPIAGASIAIDFQDLRHSTVAVTLDATGAAASFPFAAQAMKGPKVLDAARFPSITFTSTAVSAAGEAARIDGQVTIRGVTQPMQMMAHLAQVSGEAPGDYTRLTIELDGAVNRSTFGASGWADMVGDQVRLHILARIARE